MPQTDCRKPKLSLHFFEPKETVYTKGKTTPFFFFKSLTLKLTFKFFRAPTNYHMITQQSLFSARCCQLKRKAVFFPNTSHTVSPREGYPTVTSLEVFTAECCQTGQRTQTHILGREHKHTPRQSSSAFTCPAHRQRTSWHTGHGYRISKRLALDNS